MKRNYGALTFTDEVYILAHILSGPSMELAISIL